MRARNITSVGFLFAARYGANIPTGRVVDLVARASVTSGNGENGQAEDEQFRSSRSLNGHRVLSIAVAASRVGTSDSRDRLGGPMLMPRGVDSRSRAK